MNRISLHGIYLFRRWQPGLDALSKGGRSQAGRLLECPTQVGVISEAAIVGHLDDGPLRIEEEIKGPADSDLGKMITECVPQEPAKTACHMHRMNADGEGEARQ